MDRSSAHISTLREKIDALRSPCTAGAKAPLVGARSVGKQSMEAVMTTTVTRGHRRYRVLDRVYTCRVCGSMTNLQYEHDPCVACPHANACWHHEIDMRFRWLMLPHPRFLRDEILLEIADLRRMHVPIIRHDVVGPSNLPVQKHVSWVPRTFIDGEYGQCPHKIFHGGQAYCSGCTCYQGNPTSITCLIISMRGADDALPPMSTSPPA